MDTITYPVEAAKSIIVGAMEFATSVYYLGADVDRATAYRKLAIENSDAYASVSGNNIHMGVGQASNAINVMKGISTGYVYFAASVPMLATPASVAEGGVFTPKPEFDIPGGGAFDGAAGDAPLIKAPGNLVV